MLVALRDLYDYVGAIAGTASPTITVTSAAGGAVVNSGACTTTPYGIYGGSLSNAVVTAMQRTDWQSGSAGAPYLLRTPSGNAWPRSEAFDNAAWGLDNILAFGAGSVADSATSPRGDATADFICESTATGHHSVHQGCAIISDCFSIYAKSVGGRHLQIWSSVDGVYANFDLRTGVLGTSGGGGRFLSSGIQEMGNGWYRCYVKMAGSGAQVLHYGIVTSPSASLAQSYAGDGTSGLILFGAQFDTTTALSQYRKTASVGINGNTYIVDSSGAVTLAETASGTYQWQGSATATAPTAMTTWNPMTAGGTSGQLQVLNSPISATMTGTLIVAGSGAGTVALVSDVEAGLGVAGDASATVTFTSDIEASLGGANAAAVVAFMGAATGSPVDTATAASTAMVTAAAAGSPTASGTSAQAFAVSATSTGSPIVAGPAAQTVVVTGASTGTQTVTGAGAATITWASTGSGLPTGAGVGTGTVPVVGAATGAPIASGTASATVAVTEAVTGNPMASGTATATVPVTGGATATLSVAGTGTNVITLASTATGTPFWPTILATASAAILVIAQAAGSPVGSGAASASVPVATAATGTVLATGAGAATIATTAAATGREFVVGDAAATFTMAASAQASVWLSGAASATVTFTAAGRGIPISTTSWNRLTIVGHEDRVTVVQAEDRIAVVRAEPRITVVTDRSLT